MIGKKFRNLLIVAGLASAAVAAVPAMSHAKNAATTDAPMYVDQPVVAKTPVTRSKLKKHTSAKLASTKKLASKKKVHTATILYKHHNHKKSAAIKTKKHSA